MDDLGYYTIAVVLYILVFGLVGWVIGERKGRAEAGFLFGALLGPIGWLIVAVGPDVKAAEEATRMRKCPFCAELVQPDAKVCKHCGRDIAPVGREPAVEEQVVQEVEQPVKDSTIEEYERWKKGKGIK